MNNQRKLLSACLSCALLANVPSVIADDKSNDEEVIIVYGALSRTPLSEMASSISVFNEAEIQRRQAQHLEDILNSAANVNFSTGASRGRFVQIRGIGERSQFVDPVNPSVGYLVDGIDYSGLFAGASTFDVQQIEIFKGPNSARFGAEGLAGMVNVITTDAGDSASKLQAGIANYGAFNLGIAHGAEVSDSFGYRVSVHKNRRDGFIDNIHLNRDNTQNIDELTGRLKLSWQATDNLSIDTVFHMIDVDNGYDAFSLDNNRNTLSDQPGFDRQDSNAIGIEADYQGLSWANLKATVSHLSADLDYGYDEDWSFVGIRPGWEYSSTDHYLRDRTDSAFELKLSSKDAGKWVIGARFADKDEDLLREYTYAAADFTSNMKREDSALFGEYRFDLNDGSWLTASARLARQSFDYIDANSVVVNDTQSDWGAELSYHNMLDDNTMAYASLTRSYKMGGVNGEALGSIDDPALAPFRDQLLANKAFAPESLVGAEFGLKGMSQDGNFNYDLAVFYQSRKDIQYKSWVVEGQFFTGFYNNAVDGANYGIETSLNYWANDNVRLFANLGWLKAHLNDFTRRANGQIETINKRDQAHAPSYQVNLGFEWELTSGLNWVVETDHKDRFYYSYTHDERSIKQNLLHTSLSWKLDNWQLSLFARNITNQDYANRGFFFGNDPRDEYTAKLYEQLGEPRRFGVSVSYEF